MWYVKLDYNEMEDCYGLLVAGSSDTHQKSFREAARFKVFGTPEDVIRTLRELADKIERRIE